MSLALLLSALVLLVGTIAYTTTHRLETPIGMYAKDTRIEADCDDCIFNPANAGCTLERSHSFYGDATGWHCSDYKKR